MTGALSVLFCLSLVTMILFYSQLQLAEEELGRVVTPYVQVVEDSTATLYQRGLAIWTKRQQQSSPGTSIRDDDTEADDGEKKQELVLQQQKLQALQAKEQEEQRIQQLQQQKKKLEDHVKLQQEGKGATPVLGRGGGNPNFAATAEAAAAACPHLEEVAYWHAPTQKDLDYANDFMKMGAARRAGAATNRAASASKSIEERMYEYHNVDEQYVTFEPDVGGWNNIRMQMELVLVFALVTGRTLVLPFDQPMYLLMEGKGKENVHSFDDYFPFDWIAKRMPVITMQQFLEREGKAGRLFRHNTTTTRPRGRFGSNDGGNMTTNVVFPKGHPEGSDPSVRLKPLVVYPPKNSSVHNCGVREQRWAVFEYLREIGACPKFKGFKEFVAIPRTPTYNYVEELRHNPSGSKEHRIAKAVKRRFNAFADVRAAQYYSRYWQKQKVIHFISKPELGFRLMDHFYSFVFMEDERLDHFVKRFVRDYVHYVQPLFCKAALIVHSLLTEAKGGGYSAFHVRRGDLQYKEVKIPTDVLLQNVGPFIKEGQLIYIATDVRNRSYFDPMKARFPQLRFLNDYTDLVGLKGINPNFLGMLDQIVCTRGDVFVGTWFSTFTGYITRMRGYLHHLDNSNFFGDMKHRDRMQSPEAMHFPYYMREWNESWWGIDDDDHVVE